MTGKLILAPGPDHSITIDANPDRVIVRAGGRRIANSRSALTLTEAAYPPVQYIPHADIDMTLLERTRTWSYCPYKGDAAYYGLQGGRADIAWTYEEAYPAVSAIEGYLAFYPGRVDAIENLSND